MPSKKRTPKDAMADGAPMDANGREGATQGPAPDDTTSDRRTGAPSELGSTQRPIKLVGNETSRPVVSSPSYVPIGSEQWWSRLMPENLAGIQHCVQSWAEYNFPNAKDEEPLVGIQEELGEVAHAWLKQRQNIRQDEFLVIGVDSALKDGIGDMLIYMAHFCALRGITLQECFDVAWRQVRERDWQTYPSTGRPPTQLEPLP